MIEDCGSVTRVKSIRVRPAIGCRESFIIKAFITEPRSLKEIHTAGQSLIQNRSASSIPVQEEIRMPKGLKRRRKCEKIKRILHKICGAA